MDEAIDELVVDVRATTANFAQDVALMRGSLDSNLLDGFEKAGDVLERGLSRAIRSGSMGFDDLKRVAFQAIDQIIAQMLQIGVGSALGGQGGGLGGLLSGAFGALFGLPGRATGGPVSPGRGYVVGERGPELFVPTSAGRIEPDLGSAPASRDVKVAIQLAAPKGASAPVAMQRSARQVASAVRRALIDN